MKVTKFALAIVCSLICCGVAQAADHNDGEDAYLYFTSENGSTSKHSPSVKVTKQELSDGTYTMVSGSVCNTSLLYNLGARLMSSSGEIAMEFWVMPSQSVEWKKWLNDPGTYRLVLYNPYPHTGPTGFATLHWEKSNFNNL